jgi:hypothetical protein
MSHLLFGVGEMLLQGVFQACMKVATSGGSMDTLLWIFDVGCIVWYLLWACCKRNPISNALYSQQQIFVIFLVEYIFRKKSKTQSFKKCFWKKLWAFQLYFFSKPFCYQLRKSPYNIPILMLGLKYSFLTLGIFIIFVLYYFSFAMFHSWEWLFSETYRFHLHIASCSPNTHAIKTNKF